MEKIKKYIQWIQQSERDFIQRNLIQIMEKMKKYQK